jgi:hypothetical protein
MHDVINNKQSSLQPISRLQKSFWRRETLTMHEERQVLRGNNHWRGEVPSMQLTTRSYSMPGGIESGRDVVDPLLPVQLIRSPCS